MRKFKINYHILIPIILLSIISILTIYSASTYTSKSLGNLALKQCMWYFFGFILVLILIKLKNEYLYRHTWFLYILGNISFSKALNLQNSASSSFSLLISDTVLHFTISERSDIALVTLTYTSSAVDIACDFGLNIKALIKTVAQRTATEAKTANNAYIIKNLALWLFL